MAGSHCQRNSNEKRATFMTLRDETLQQTGKGEQLDYLCLEIKTGCFTERQDIAEHKLRFSQINYWVHCRGNGEI